CVTTSHWWGSYTDCRDVSAEKSLQTHLCTFMVIAMPAFASPPADEFLDRFGDVLDDRVAEVIDEVLEDRVAQLRRPRLRPALAAATMLFAVLATFMLRHHPVAVCTVWP